METWTGAFPQLLAAYEHKERFYHIWGCAPWTEAYTSYLLWGECWSSRGWGIVWYRCGVEWDKWAGWGISDVLYYPIYKVIWHRSNRSPFGLEWWERLKWWRAGAGA